MSTAMRPALESAAYAAAAAVARSAIPLAERRRQRVLNNLLRVRPDWEAPRLNRAVRRVFEETARYGLDLAMLARVPAREVLDDRLRVAGLDRLRQALEAGGGAILTAPHVSTPEAALVGLSALGIRAVAMVEAPRSSRRLRALQRLRDASPAAFAFADAKGAAGVMRALEAGDAACILWDRDVQRPIGSRRAPHANPNPRARYGGVCVPFFGRQAHFPVGAVDIALRTGAPLLPVSVRRRRGFSFEVGIGGPLPLPRTENHALDVRTGVADLARLSEPAIADACEQWRMFESPWAPCRDAPPTAPASPMARPKSIV